MRIRYRRRRETAVAALATALPRARVTGAAAGLYVHAALGDDFNEAAALRAAAAAGVWVDGVAAHRAPGGRGAGVLIGYANLAETAIARGVALLGAAIASADG
jgi:GntR family transcriptional regulator/MocR family aminotransferase